MSSASPCASRAFSGLAAELGLAVGEGASAIGFQQDDPLVESPHRLGAAAAAALMLQAVAAACVWRHRGGRPQRLAIDISDAVEALDTGRHLRQSGYFVTPHFTVASPLTGFHKTGDGAYVCLVGARPAHRDQMLRLLGCAHDGAAITHALQNWTGHAIEEACLELRLPGCRVRSAAEWREHPQGAWLASQPVVGITRTSQSIASRLPPGERPLAGLRVLDLSHVLAGPIAARTLAEHGADVLRITSPRQPEDTARILDTGWGKRAAYLDLDLAEDRLRLESLISGADVLVNSYRPGGLARRGFGSDRLAELRPGLVYLDVSCYGGGPWSEQVGFDPNAQAATGIAMSEGGGGVPRTVPTILVNDLLTAYLGAAGVMAALVRRAREGGSYTVSVSLARTAMWVQDLGLLPQPYPSLAERKQPSIATVPSQFGPLTRLLPPVTMSETPPVWSVPPVPLGSSQPEWT